MIITREALADALANASGYPEKVWTADDCVRCDGTGQVRWETSLGTPIGRTELGQCPDCDGSGVTR